MLSLVSLHISKKRDHFEQKKLIIIKGKFFLGDYLVVSFVTILRMNASPSIITF